MRKEKELKAWGDNVLCQTCGVSEEEEGYKFPIGLCIGCEEALDND